MTKYEYTGEMQKLCFKISQACKVLDDKGLQEFYLAASEGYVKIRESYTVEEAQGLVDNKQLDMLESTTAYVKEVQKKAGYKLDLEVTA